MQTNISKTRFDAVVFDLDGTLANTFPTVLRIFNRLMLERTGREWKLAELAPYFGPPETVMIQRIFADHDNMGHETIFADYFRLCREDGHEIEPFDGIRDLVHSLREAGVKLGIYSGANTESARIRIGHAGLLEYFDAIIGGDAVSNYKPHPEGLVKLIEQFDVDPSRTVYIGDMVADVEAGRGAGATTVAVTWGAGKREALAAAKPDFLVERPESLRNVIY
ncbi:MAG: HAD-IA family hydrolase [Acidobacteriota bacterium]